MTSYPYQRVVVTGAGSGLGRAFCDALARPGAHVIVSDIDPKGAEETAARVRAAGAQATVQLCDVRDHQAIEDLSALADDVMGGTDLVINNAGVGVAGPIGQVSLEDWRWVMDINLWGVIYGCRTFIPKMVAQGQGAVINVASAAGLLSAPGMAPYNVTKHGVVGLSETLHAELKKQGVHVSVLCPTFFKTNIFDSGRGPTDPAQEAIGRRAAERSKIQAPGVAAASLDCVTRNQLYCVPMPDGLMFWRIKRLAPNLYYTLLNMVLNNPKLLRFLG